MTEMSWKARLIFSFCGVEWQETHLSRLIAAVISCYDFKNQFKIKGVCMLP
jgi:hypothetical protein